ncbi:SDR family NAD(P)-dependent oxidoreductase [Vibrio algicola]|uniref:SDR family NAD(P)-dependent oxidoreductase n=1 Tax=Vibrio algicola TaxID=2662262 RepID=A0A5Q0TAH0_9VIBR|nr:SDR family NAD(P)-dependent oxidoreductase [Vibrio algicola]
MKVMITGATSGIGKELAIRYANQGHQVIACGRSEEKLQRLADSNSYIRTLCFELTDFHHYPQLEHDIDLLILNAGDCYYIQDPLNFNAEAFERTININLISIGYGLQAWLKNITQGGRLVLVSSSAAILPLPKAEAYGASKAGLTYLAKTLALTLKPHHISVSVVQPGFVDTPLTERNNFPMPMILTSQVAAQKIIQGISKGKAEINVPLSFVLIMKILRCLPHFIWRYLAVRMT